MTAVPEAARRCIGAMWASGATDNEVAAALGVAVTSAAKYRIRLKLKKNKPAWRRTRLLGRTGEIVQRRATGASLTEIADALGITVQSVQGALRRAETISVEPNYDRAAWAKAHDAGGSVRAIARAHGVSAPTVLRSLRAQGRETSRPKASYPQQCAHTLKRHQNRIKGLCPSCWRRQYPGPIKAALARRQARRANAAGPDFTAAEWEQKAAKYEGRCAYCGCRARVHADHVVPLARGGANSIENIVPACSSCNHRKNTRTWTPWPPARVFDGSAERFGPVRIACPALVLLC